MKKTLIATAVAAVVMAAPAAMADITVAGQLQAEIVNASGDGMGGNGEGLYMSDGWSAGDPSKQGASAFIVKGSHDIGNGLTGLYIMNMGLKTGDDFGGIFGRDVYVGLSGGFGTVLMGRLNTPYKSSTVKWDPFFATFLQARGNGGMSGAGHNGYLGNVLAYANKLGPASIVVAAGFDESNDNPADADADNDHALTASVNVPVGPVELALAYVDTGGVNIGSFTQDGISNVEAIKLGLKYGAGPLTVAAQYETIDVGGNAAFDQIFATAGYKFGANTVALNVGIKQPDTGDDGEYFALGLKHAFNKSVSALVGVSKSDDQDSDSTVDDDLTLAGVSLRVKF